ncbi:hypothetical protein CO038_00760 [Candidatus Pacearchaeota archaeon CG_4_9_14_0_2_um_filter_39_13]|nr:MAG: hypothetical protein CO038_00760 [Candidatus Pacearchaeota archaeon CG_4_9_14_0_2_um_filter_39_13]
MNIRLASKMTPLHKKILSVAILLILVALAIYYLKNNISDFNQLAIVSPWLIILLVILFLITYVAISSINLYLLKPLGVNLEVKESFMLSVMTGFYNLITPFRGGMAARAVYLKKKYKFPYTDFLATLAASYVLIFLVAGIVGLFSVYYIYKITAQLSLIILGVFLVSTLSMLFIIIFSPRIPETKYPWLNRFIRVINGWHLIRKNKKVVLATLFFSFLQLLIGSTMLYLQFRVFGIQIPFTSTLFITALNSIGILLAITPAGLGITEAITVFSASTLGILPAQSLSAALLGRAISLIVLFILGPIFSYILLKKKPSDIIRRRK